MHALLLPVYFQLHPASCRPANRHGVRAAVYCRSIPDFVCPESRKIPYISSGDGTTVDLKERSSRTAPHRNKQGVGCSNKGFLPMSAADFLSLLDWTAQQQRADSRRGNKRGSTRRLLAL